MPDSCPAPSPDAPITAILTLNASPAQLGVLGAVQAVPVLWIAFSPIRSLDHG